MSIPMDERILVEKALGEECLWCDKICKRGSPCVAIYSTVNLLIKTVKRRDEGHPECIKEVSRIMARKSDEAL